MKATLKLEDGREIAVDVSEETLKEIEKPVKKTGYEKAPLDKFYWYFDGYGIDNAFCGGGTTAQMLYENANYYSNKTVAENNARADALTRRLRRFAVEHREHELDWNDSCQTKWLIDYDYGRENLGVYCRGYVRDFNTIYFDTKETAEAAIEEFKDELIWYFTDYKDSL